MRPFDVHGAGVASALGAVAGQEHFLMDEVLARTRPEDMTRISRALRTYGYLDDDGNTASPRLSFHQMVELHILYSRSPRAIDDAFVLGRFGDARSFSSTRHGLYGLDVASLAAISDSDTGELLLLPLVLARTGLIDRIDSAGRSLRDFPISADVDAYLENLGVRRNISGGRGELPSLEGCNPATPIAAVDWSSTLRPGLYESMVSLGYVSGVREDISANDLAPLNAIFHAEIEIRHAVLGRDAERSARLIELGALNSNRSFAHGCSHPALAGKKLDIVALAVLSDCKHGTFDFTDLILANVGASHQDVLGRTLLHFAITPEMCAYLLERGVDPRVADRDGVIPSIHLPEPCLAILEAMEMGVSLAGARGARTIGRL
jgi:hypothetical protein